MFIIESEKYKISNPPGAYSQVKHLVQTLQIRGDALEFQDVGGGFAYGPRKDRGSRQEHGARGSRLICATIGLRIVTDG